MDFTSGQLNEQVKPLNPVTPKLYTLSTVDQYVPKAWITRMVYFPLDHNKVPAEIYDQLKTGLSHVLTMYPQMTGQVRRQPDKPHWVAIQTSAEGSVQFTFRDHTTSTDEVKLPSYARLKELNFPMQGMVATACHPVTQYEVSEGSCMFAAQANFVEGGLVLASTVNHICVDGAWWNELFKLWASYTDLTSAPHTTEVIEHSMKIVSQLSVPTSETPPDPQTWTIGDATASNFLMAPPSTPASGLVHPRDQPNSGSPDPVLPLGSQVRTWTISPQKQAALKSTAKAYSTMDSIYSLFWNRAATHSYVPTTHPTALARIPIDMRTRVSPCVPNSYMGNTVSLMTAPIPSLSLVGPIAEKLPLITSAIRTTIRAYTEEEFMRFIGTANTLPPSQALINPTNIMLTPSILLNDHSKLGIMTYDFGTLGKAERMRDAVDDLPIRNVNIVLVLPRLEDGTLEVMTVLDHEVVAGLEKDPEFLEFFGCGGDGKLVM